MFGTVFVTVVEILGRSRRTPPVNAPGLAPPAPPDVDPTPEPRDGVVAPPPFQRPYAAAVVAVDVIAMDLAVWLYTVWGAAPPRWPGGRMLPSIGFLVLGILVLTAARAWDGRVLGQGTEEFNRLFWGFCYLGVATALIGLALKAAPLRPYAFGVAPSALAFAMLGRWLLRTYLHRQRARGRCMRNVLAVGSVEAVSELITRTKRAPYSGWRITGACVPDGPAPGANALGDVPILASFDSIAQTARQSGSHVVAVSPTQGWNPRRLHRLLWDLEGSGVAVVVDPGLMEIAGPRVRIDTIDGVPMLRLSEPTFTGIERLTKNATDAVVSALLLVLLAPVMVMIAIAIKRGGGPVLYRQTRVGRNGATFTIVKFRTMTVGADQLLDGLRQHNHGAGPMFKVANDPRVTRIGRILRRWSLDELPQLLNVLRGSMSLVGPRPPLPNELAGYDREARRRLLVKPGITGLWQVSGRSDLSWEESVRLDRRYVENWTLLLDALIVCKTIGSVVRRRGAY